MASSSGDGTSEIQLGFVERVASWKLHHRYFPSKVGGLPAWLDLRNLPLPADVQCSTCSEPMSFLLQIYAPDEKDDKAFHRTIYVFACRRSQCMKSGDGGGMVMYRCCLPRRNQYYSFDPPVHDADLLDPAVVQPLCSVCGCLAPNLCTACRKVFYCSRSHQMLAWKHGHKEDCSRIKDDVAITHTTVTCTPAKFAEYEITIEPEILDEYCKDERPDDERILDYKKTLMDVKPSLNDTSVDDLAAFCSKSTDKTFQQFRKRVNQNPDQILRYNRGGVPLLISIYNAPKTIPKCQCGAPRQFEFQVMPQILNFVEQEETLEEGLDFGTILIYTCSRNCGSEQGYIKEYSWVQMVEEDSKTTSEQNGNRMDVGEDDEEDDDSDSD